MNAAVTPLAVVQALAAELALRWASAPRLACSCPATVTDPGLIQLLEGQLDKCVPRAVPTEIFCSCFASSLKWFLVGVVTGAVLIAACLFEFNPAVKCAPKTTVIGLEATELIKAPVGAKHDTPSGPPVAEGALVDRPGLRLLRRRVV